MSEEPIDLNEKKEKGTKQQLTKRLAVRWRALGKRRWILVGIVLFIVIAGGVWAFSHSGNFPVLNGGSDNISLVPAPPEKIATQELPLTGEFVTQEEYDSIMQYLPMAVMIENLSSVRPVSGLSRADLVFEALVEGGITRYMAVFHSQDVDEILPVRSSRAYYLDWMKPLDATYMHIGGAVSSNPLANALPRIASEGIKSYGNINGTWWRRSDRVAPHNAFTSTQRMKDAQNSQGWARKPDIPAWQYKDDVVQEDIPDIEKTIDIIWGSRGVNEYSVRWVYNPIDNNYIYEVGGVRQTDPVTNDDLTAKNVIVQFERVSPANDGSVRVVYETTGTGRALVFRDGTVVEGTWRKHNSSTRDRYFDSESHEVQFNRGRTWVVVVPNESQVTY